MLLLLMMMIEVCEVCVSNPVTQTQQR